MKLLIRTFMSIHLIYIDLPRHYTFLYILELFKEAYFVYSLKKKHYTQVTNYCFSAMS